MKCFVYLAVDTFRVRSSHTEDGPESPASILEEDAKL